MNPPTQPPPIPVSARPVPPMEDNATMRMLLPIGRSGWAIAAGYLGLFSVLLIPAPLALAASIAAIREIKRSRTSSKPKHGMGRAVFGLVMGALGSIALIGAVIAGAARRH